MTIIISTPAAQAASAPAAPVVAALPASAPGGPAAGAGSAALPLFALWLGLAGADAGNATTDSDSGDAESGAEPVAADDTISADAGQDGNALTAMAMPLQATQMQAAQLQATQIQVAQMQVTQVPATLLPATLLPATLLPATLHGPAAQAMPVQAMAAQRFAAAAGSATGASGLTTEAGGTPARADPVAGITLKPALPDSRTPQSQSGVPILPAMAAGRAPAPDRPAGAAMEQADAPHGMRLAGAADRAAPADAERHPSAAVAGGGWSMALPAAGNNAAPGDAISLNGPARQWQQPLQEALGERIQLQLARNSDHALIRLDPPMLGRIEISIKYSAGALQVNLSASNGEVLQQLRSIGEGMRNDLAQRQYTDVSVSIAATPRSAAAHPSLTDGEAGARQQQPGRDPDESGPGRALSEAGQPFSTFALNGQE